MGNPAVGARREFGVSSVDGCAVQASDPAVAGRHSVGRRLVAGFEEDMLSGSGLVSILAEFALRTAS